MSSTLVTVCSVNGVCTNTVVLVFLRFGVDGITMIAEGVLRSGGVLRDWGLHYYSRIGFPSV